MLSIVHSGVAINKIGDSPVSSAMEPCSKGALASQLPKVSGPNVCNKASANSDASCCLPSKVQPDVAERKEKCSGVIPKAIARA